MTSRREFIGTAALSAFGLSAVTSRLPRVSGGAQPRSSFLDLLRPPDLVIAQSETADHRLETTSSDRWIKDDIVVVTAMRRDALSVSLSAARSAVKRIHLRWRGDLSGVRLILGDAWERGYGDLEWRGWVPDRVMP